MLQQDDKEKQHNKANCFDSIYIHPLGWREHPCSSQWNIESSVNFELSSFLHFSETLNNIWKMDNRTIRAQAGLITGHKQKTGEDLNY